MARPKVLNGFTAKMNTACGTLYVIVNRDEKNNLKEVFLNLGKSGTCGKAFMEMAGRLLTHAIRKDVDISAVIKSIKGIRCKDADDERLSCADAIAQALEIYLQEKAEDATKQSI